VKPLHCSQIHGNLLVRDARLPDYYYYCYCYCCYSTHTILHYTTIQHYTIQHYTSVLYSTAQHSKS